MGIDSVKSVGESNDRERLASESSGQRHGSRIISSILSPAVQLWLRSQVQSVDELSIKIEGSDRQILHGTIPKVSLKARGAVYQGLHLTDVNLAATGIRINIGQVIRGKSLRLLEPVPVMGEVQLAESDLNQSLQAPLLLNALSEFLIPQILGWEEEGDGQPSFQLQNPQIQIETDRLTLKAAIVGTVGRSIPFTLQAGLRLVSPRELSIDDPHIQLSQGFKGGKLESFQIDLGSEVNLERLTLTPGQIVCQGGIRVMP